MIYVDEKVFMNTIIRVQVVSCRGTVFTREKIALALEQFEHVVKHFSRFTQTSELSRLNSGKLKEGKVSSELYQLVEKALQVAELTDGAYDPTVIDLLEAYGYDRKNDFSKLADPGLALEISKMALGRPSFRKIKLDPEATTIVLQPGQRIDLGSIGKGYAVDLAYKVLSGNRFDGFLINAGGDIRVFGNNPEGIPWRIMLYRSQLPNQRISTDNCLGMISLQNSSIAGSGGWARKVGIFHHLLNPRTGLPVNEVAQTYVMADTATDSDVWATALFVTGKAGLKILHQQEKAGLLVDFQGNIYKTPDFEYDN